MIRLLTRIPVEYGNRALLLAFCVVVAAGDVVAQSTPGGIIGNVIRPNSSQSYASDILKSQVESSRQATRGSGSVDLLTEQFTLPPLPGGNGVPSDSSPNPQELAPGRDVEAVGRRSVIGNQVVVQPLAGQRQLSNSAPISNMLVKQSTDKVAIAFSTMNMVENGAATGYFAALNTTNNLMQGVMKAHELQLNTLKLTDQTGVQTEAYLNRVDKIVRETKQDSGPAAILGALGDKPEGDIGSFARMPEIGAARVVDLHCGVPFVDPRDGFTAVKLSDLLFCKDDASDPGKVSQIQAKKNDFTNYLGDALVKELVKKDDKGREIEASKQTKLDIIQPVKDSKGRSGIARVKWEQHVAAFEALGIALSGYCTYRTSNKNWGKDMWDQKKTPSLILREDPDSLMKMRDSTAWHYAGAPDMPLTESFVEQLYLHVVKTSRIPTAAECKSLAVKESDMPTSAQSGTPSVNDCSKDKGCLRNRLLFFVSDLVARSRTFHLYQQVISQTNAFATTARDQNLLKQMLQGELGEFDLDEAILNNLRTYNSYKELQAKFFQGQVGGSNFLSNMDSNSPSGFTAGRK